MHNTTVAKLLAKENIEVQYGNYHTAWFDIQSRTLGLPLWKDMGKDVHDLLVGHEVGHALYTPYEGWHDTPEKLEGCPRSYINVVEDARIERLIRKAYPGLVGPMSRGYKKLADDEFFGDISNPDWDQIKLIDKINLKAKLNNLIEVPFNTEEATLFNKTMNTETFEEVLEVVKEILAYAQDNTPELIQEPEQSDGSDVDLPEDSDDMGPQGHDDYQAPEQEETEDTDKGENNSDQENSSEESQENDADGQEEEGNSSNGETEEEGTEEGIAKTGKKPAVKDKDQSVTDVLYRDNEKRLLETNKYGEQTIVARDRGKKTIESTVTPYSQLRLLRKEKWNNTEDYVKEQHKNILEDYASYMKGVKKSVNVAVKEFEMKKAAFQWQRASSAKTGVLDTNSLHQYRTHDDIFKRVTSLADAKNHGMIMLIDYSGSMASTLPQVLDQLIHLVTFCKAINIPFDVYAFTSYWMNDREKSMYAMKDGEFDFDDLSLPQLISSSLSKAHYEEALQHLYMRKLTCAQRYNSYDYDRWYSDDAIIARQEDFGGTPLNTALVTTHHLVKDFIKKHAVEKMNLVILSDGDSQNLQVVRDRKLADRHADITGTYEGKIDAIIDGKKAKITGRRIGATHSLLDNLKKRYGVTTLGFFIAQDVRDWKTKICQILGQEWVDSDSVFYKDMNRQYNKNKVAIVDNTLGYDKFFMLKPGKKLEASTEDFADQETDNMSTSQIRNSFKKYSKNKKNNKVLMKNLGGVVA